MSTPEDMMGMEGIPPADDRELETRRGGWRNFLHGLRDAFQDPIKSHMLFELGAALARDRQPGQSSADHLSRAFSAAQNAGAGAQQQLATEGRENRQEARQERQVDLQEQEIEQRGDIARTREEGMDRRLEAQLGSNEELARIRERADERRHNERMAAEERSLKQRIASINAQLSSARLDRAARIDLENTKFKHQKKLEQIKAEASGKGNGKLMLDIIDVATSEDFEGKKTIDWGTVNRIAAVITGKSVGEGGDGGSADSLADQIVTQARAEGWNEQRIRRELDRHKGAGEGYERLVQAVNARLGEGSAGTDGRTRTARPERPQGPRSVEDIEMQLQEREEQELLAKQEEQRVAKERAEQEKLNRELIKQANSLINKLKGGVPGLVFHSVNVSQEAAIQILSELDQIKNQVVTSGDNPAKRALINKLDFAINKAEKVAGL